MVLIFSKLLLYYSFSYIRTEDGEFIDTEICAIDAVDYRFGGKIAQYEEPFIYRETLKAYVGFYKTDSQKLTEISTGILYSFFQ
jgi:hypothetical protein